MVDLNSWALRYDDVDFRFGTLDTGFPFQVQIQIGDPAITTQDVQHPGSDGEVSGRDTLGGFDITMTLRTIPGGGVSPWVASLDAVSKFKAMWRADSVRSQPGKYARLVNLSRNRMVYGRPRKFTPTLSRLRKGDTSYIATFHTNDPNFYSATAQSINVHPGDFAHKGVPAPIKSPFNLGIRRVAVEYPENKGDLPTWPIIEFHGPATSPSITLSATPTSPKMWVIGVRGKLKADEVMRVDTRPWSRSATINGKPANGRLRGDALAECQLPVGMFAALYTAQGTKAASIANITWNDAYASL